ncbi:hypothetical protein ACFLYE_01500 [Chloroflexota bacterium]
MYFDRDYYGWHGQCLQCGYTRELKSEVELERQPVKGKKKPVLVP